MSSDPVIRVSQLNKSFPIYARPADRLKQFLLPRIQRMLGLNPKQYYRTFTALSDISFEIQRGETVGIIGRNGAGKSTLLQILCGTLSPTSGEVEIKGRVAALLELGAGFNSEYTGRENVHMNARILGLTDEEIAMRFDDIVAFAEIGEHLDQPVKTYSSGMFVRLAFSVVVNVDANVLIIDEALAVGDAFFQAKCIAKLRQRIESGATLLFVSHDIHAVKSLCNRGILLNAGRVTHSGDTLSVSEAYYRSQHGNVSNQITSIPEIIQDDASSKPSLITDNEFANRARFQRVSNGLVNLTNVFFENDLGHKINSIEFGQTVRLCFEFSVNQSIACLGSAYHIRTHTGFDVVYSDTGIEKKHLKNLTPGMRVSLTWQFKLLLREGQYTVAAMLSIPTDLNHGFAEVCDFVPLAAAFSVSRGYSQPIYGAVYWPNTMDINIYDLEQ